MRQARHPIFSISLMLLLLCQLIPARQIFAQNKEGQIITVKGTVKATDGTLLTGASVTDKKTAKATATDDKGYYSISVADNAELEYSMVGFSPQTVHVNKRSVIDISMTENITKLDEMVVIGYGIKKKSDLTGAVSQVNMAKVETQQAISLGDYLRGSIAGLNIQRSASASGQTTFEIRGQNSLSAKSAPLIVVDGMIYSGSVNDINPNDVENVSVLKDASSAAVYGASAAGGVINITTKQGKSEKPIIRFDAKTSMAFLQKKPQTYDVEGYLNMRADKLIGNGNINQVMPEYYSNPYQLQNVSLAAWLAYSGAALSSDPTEVWLSRLNLAPNEKMNYYNYDNINWLDKVFRTGILQDYNLSVSGKSKGWNYYWSAGYLNNQGVVVNNKYQNIRSRINLSNNITKFLEVGVRAGISTTNADGQAADWAKAYDNSPLGTMYNQDGTYSWYPNGDNMARNSLGQTQFDTYNRNNVLTGSFFTKLKLPYGFRLESSFNNRAQFREQNQYRPSYTIEGAASHGLATRDYLRQYDWSLENVLYWDKTFNGIHRFNLTLMQSSAKWMQYQTTATASQFNTSEALGWHAMNMGMVFVNNSKDQYDTKASYMGRLDYGLLDRYMVTLTMRRDGYSAFGQNNPWANFPAAAVAWRISKEDFMKQVDWLSNLKLRASYGKNGNSNIGRYTALAGLGTEYYLDGNKQNVVTIYPTSMGNNTLQWEETLASNLGLDIGILDNRINFTVEAYQMKTTNMLIDRTLPSLTGYSKVKANLGRVDNKGLEISANTLNINNSNFKWTTDVTFSLNRNEIKSLYGDEAGIYDSTGKLIGRKELDDPTNGWYIGHAIDQVYSYKIIGVWQKDEAAQAAALGFTPGDYKTYKAAANNSYSRADYQWIGYTKPRYRIAINNMMTILKDFQLQFMIRSEWGHVNDANELAVGSYADRVSQMKFPYWTQENQSNEWGKLGAKKTGTIYKNASFIRLENISLAYTLPKSWSKAISMPQPPRIFFNIDNVYCIDKWRYFDVETKAPTPTTFTFGINATL
jgi:TonB-dependent starch-binding outer membrane protein SusC